MTASARQDVSSSSSGLHTILGAGGAVANQLVPQLLQNVSRVRLVGRHPQALFPGAESFPADLSDLDQTIAAVSGSSVVYLLVGLTYDRRIWRQFWPRIMDNAIEACKRANAGLVFFDNVYMYGKADGVMTEQTPFNPCSAKGEIRSLIATKLLEEMRAGRLRGMIGRSADFYGSHVRTSLLNILVVDKLAAGRKALWLINDSVPHSFTFVPDAARALALLARSEQAWNQTWHLPTSPHPPTGKLYIEMIARGLGVLPRYRILNRPMVWAAGWFDRQTREVYEMLYQNDREYRFDSTKFSSAFGVLPTSYADGIKQTVAG